MEYLPCKQEHLRLLPLRHGEKPRMACSSRVLVISVPRRQRWVDLWGSLASKSDLLVKFQSSENLASKPYLTSWGRWLSQQSAHRTATSKGLSLDLPHLFRSQEYLGGRCMSETLVANGEFPGSVRDIVSNINWLG